MIACLQRVTQAKVEVAGNIVGSIGPGLLVLIGVERGDAVAQVDRLLERLLGYRIFSDDAGKMNLSLQQTGGGLLLVPQFTLAADTSKGRRPSFTTAAEPDEGRRLFECLLARAGKMHPVVASGRFGDDMQVSLTNDGPVTFWLRAGPQGKSTG